MDWPLVDPKDDGIRPAGRTDQCFYCHRLVGEEHTRQCVCVTKLVRMRYSFEIDVRVPHSDTEDETTFYMNESSSCANNRFRELQKETERMERESEDLGGGVKHGECWCSRFGAEFVQEVDATPHRKLRR